MGVQGLWHLLQPCARPTKLESLEGRRLAIDSSIWLYHFQMAMRDKEGRTLSNAHILGFLWRILKLIHYGIRPIFVFDGGAPVMKRQTLVGRRQRKAGAKDSHQRIAERLLNARLREAAVAHVAGGGASTSTVNQGDTSSGGAAAESHGLGQNTVYFDDLTAGGSSSANTGDDAAAWVDVADGGAAAEEAEETEAQKKKKRNDWHKDPYALPALERDINTMTANTSTATKNARGGGKRQDVRFATEGELRALLSSIGPTDLDLDSEFFRSLPSELQYELVGDMRAASRGTSYKRLQAMLSQSPTPIDFSRAQIAGLKTRNELTQKVLEVTDEIGDAHIKVPIRVAGARNREYVLVRNKGDQGGFALGVRDAGTSQDKAIAVDEDTASATTDDDFERRTTDEEIDLEEVPIQPSPEKSKRETEAVPSALLKANPNDPVARREVAKELLQRRAKALAKEKAAAQGWRDDGEEMEEQLRRVKAAQRKLARQGQKRSNAKSSAPRKSALFRGGKSGQKNAPTYSLPVQNVDTEEEDEDEEDQDDDWDDLLDQQEAADLGRALDESERAVLSKETEDVDEEDASDLELEEVPTHAFESVDYSSFYTAKPQSKSTSDDETPSWITTEKASPSKVSSATSLGTVSPPAKSIKKSSRAIPDEMDPRLRNKKPSEHEAESEAEKATSVHTISSETSSPVLPAARYTTWDPKYTRVISISDSDASVEEVPSQQFNPVAKADVVTTRTEQSNHRDGGGNEIKVVDFQDKTVDEISGDPGGMEEEQEDQEQSVATVTPNGDSDGGSEPLQLPPTPNAEETLAAEESLMEDEGTRQGVGRDESMSDVAADQLEDDEDDDPASPLGVARRAESILPSPGILEVEEDLEKQTGEKVTLDNVSSRADEAGEYPRMEMEGQEEGRLGAEQSEEEIEEGRDSEDEHSDYSNKGFRRNGSGSDSDEEDTTQPQVVLGPDGFPLPSAEELAAMDAEDEAELGEMANDQDEFVSFLSRAKGQGLNQVRKEVEDEVNQLRSEHATTRRTEGEVTIQMAKEIQFMLRLFGLPYITAPMEAEAQCAELIQLKLADGIITDDSDVFLFGGTFVYKNMFNNKKYVECYKLADLQHDLGMDRTKLVQLAYLLGSDYTEGLEGVGPVLAMEILSHFPGQDGLVKFREWWRKVQMGKDTPKDTYDSVLKRLKKTLRNKVHLESHWPDPNVIDAYFEPTVDSSNETFQWGLPDLDSLRSFFKEYLRWDQEKTDHYLLPAIEAQNRRSKRQGNQTTLDRANFFDLKAGEGAFAGREKPKYHSNRLQQIVNGFRASNTGKADGNGKEKGKGTVDVVTLSGEEEEEEPDDEDLIEESKEQAKGKKSRPISHKKAKANGKDADREGSNKQRQKGKRKARETSPGVDNVHDQEWSPAKAKRSSKARQAAKRPGVTSLSQARNMSLDSIANLPPSRAGTRSQADSQVEQQSIVLSNDEDESSLTEQE